VGGGRKIEKRKMEGNIKKEVVRKIIMGEG
jgi:hypothetical protein